MRSIVGWVSLAVTVGIIAVLLWHTVVMWFVTGLRSYPSSSDCPKCVGTRTKHWQHERDVESAIGWIVGLTVFFGLIAGMAWGLS